MDGDMIEHHHHHNKYTMWMNSQQVLVPRVRASPSSGYNDQYYESWEERAFAEDAARGLGGFIWPPRSYTCSFCRREFKSAQALGGHMNVHRRDRARLKQALSPNSSEKQQHAASSLQKTTITLQTSNDSPNEDFEDHARKKSSEEMKTQQQDNDKELHVNTKLCMGLKLGEVLITSGNNKCNKRHKSSNFILVDPCLVVHQSGATLLHHEVHHDDIGGVKMRLMEELDLELRLGV